MSMMVLPEIRVEGERFSMVYPQSTLQMLEIRGESGLQKHNAERLRTFDELSPIEELWKTTQQSQESGVTRECISKFEEGRRWGTDANITPMHAAGCFCAAADEELPEAMYEVACFCEGGVGVQQSRETALKVYSVIIDKCQNVLKTPERSTSEKVRAHYLLALCYYKTMDDPSQSIDEFGSVKKLIKEGGISALKTVEAADDWISFLRAMKGPSKLYTQLS